MASFFSSCVCVRAFRKFFNRKERKKIRGIKGDGRQVPRDKRNLKFKKKRQHQKGEGGGGGGGGLGGAQ